MGVRNICDTLQNNDLKFLLERAKWEIPRLLRLVVQRGVPLPEELPEREGGAPLVPVVLDSLLDFLVERWVCDYLPILFWVHLSTSYKTSLLLNKQNQNQIS